MKFCCCLFLILFAVVFSDPTYAQELEIMLEGYQIIDFAIDDDNIWCATNGDGIVRYDKIDGNIVQFTEKDGLIDNFVEGVAVDKKGTVWFSYDLGVTSIKDDLWNNYLSSELYDKRRFSHIVVDNSNIKWFVANGTIAIDDTMGITEYPGGWDYVFVDINNIKWFGAYGARGSYDDENWIYYFDDEDLSFSYFFGGSDSNMRQYWGGGDGFRIIDGENSTTITEVDNVLLGVTAVVVDENDTVWLGTNSGLWSYSEGEFEHLIDFEETHNDLIYDIEIDNDGFVWFCTWIRESGILAKYTPEKPLSASNNPTPTQLSLNPATPNPFNAQTTLAFTLPSENMTTLSIYDITGRIVRELVSGR